MNRTNQTKICFLQWNCRSIQTNLSYLIQHLQCNDYQALLLQSLNVNSNKLPKLDNYYYPPIYHRENKKDKVNCAIYIRIGLNYSLCSSPAPQDTPDLYLCGATVHFCDSLVINLLSVYLPKGPNDHNTEWIRSLQFQNEKWIVAGDFNAHSTFWNPNCETVTSNRFIENIVDSSLYLLNDGSITRIPDISHHRASAIDLTFISPELATTCTWTTFDDTLGSDHIPIITTLNDTMPIPDPNQDKIPKYNYDRADWESFERILFNFDTNKIKNENIDVMYTNFTDTILSAANSCIPKYKNIKSKKNNGNVWWCKACEEAVQNKKEKYKQYIRNKTEINHTLMKQAKINCNRVIAEAKKNYWNTFCSSEISNHKDLKKIWKKVHEMKNGIQLPQYPIKLDNNKFPSNCQKAEIFAEMFTKTSCVEGLPDTCKKFRTTEESKEMYADPTPTNEHYVNAPITLQELKNELKTLSNKKTSVGLDAISNQMLKHLPDNWIVLLQEIFKKCWEDGCFPSVWRKSIIVPISKQGKPKSDKNSYRPIALTSHTCKLMEKIILNRLHYFCEKNHIIPVIQAGFRKGRSTTDHLVKLTTQIKHQFARRQNVLATFFDIKKAYDQVWHSRLLYKLKTIGISGKMYNYVKNFLSDRTIQVKIGTTYSSEKSLDMGIPQGSVMAPILFNILMHDLTKKLSSKVTLLQYADDICMWANVNIKSKTNLRTINYIKKVYQCELDKLNVYIVSNGLQFSVEKTKMIFFSPGSNPTNLPVFKLDGESLEYKQMVKFLGIHLTSKLNWNIHIEHMITKARKSLNFLKIISKQSWSMNVQTLVHLSSSLIRSRLSFGQEVFFSASKYLLKKLQSIDSKGFKLALGVPFHASSVHIYKELGILPLDEYRQLSTAKYILRSSAVDNSVTTENFIRSDTDFPKRARAVASQMSMATYTASLFRSSEINPRNVASRSPISPIPNWELQKPTFDINYVDLQKNENQNLLSVLVKSHLETNYINHLKIFTDGSVLDNKQSGAAFVIPELRVEKSYFLGKNYSIFTAELQAILMALHYLVDLPQTLFQTVICVDSKSVLTALQSYNDKTRPEMIIEISHLVNSLILRGTDLCFCWIPSHCGIFGNEWVDRAAKRGANNSDKSEKVTISFSVQEGYSLLKKTIFEKSSKQDRFSRSIDLSSKIQNVESRLNLISKTNSFSRQIISLFFRFRLNALKTKFSKNINCICGSKLDISHILFNCQSLKSLFPKSFTDLSLTEDKLFDLLHNTPMLCDIIQCLIQSPILPFL